MDSGSGLQKAWATRHLRIAWKKGLSQLTPGSVPMPELCLCNSVSWTLAGYQISNPAAQICLNMNNS